MELLDRATSGRSVPSTELELLESELRDLHLADGDDSRVYLVGLGGMVSLHRNGLTSSCTIWRVSQKYVRGDEK